MKKAAPKGNNQRNTKENGCRITRTKRKPKCGANPSTLQDIKANGAKGAEKNNTVQGRKKINGLKVKNRVVGNPSGSGTSAKNKCQKSGEVTAGSKPATKHNLPPQTGLRGNDSKDLSRNKRNDTESEEEELVSTAESSGEATEEEISDEEEERRYGRSVSAEGDSSEEDTESSGSQRNTEQTAINSVGKETFVESKCSSSPEVNTHASSTEEEDARGDSSAGLKDETQNKEVSQEDTSERLTADRTRGQRARPSCTSTPAKESKYKMFKRTKGDKQAQKDEKRRVKAEKQRLEKEAKQKAKEEKKNKKKPLKAEKHASVSKDIQSAGSTVGKYKKINGKNKSVKQTRNTEEDACGIANMSEVSDEEDDEGEPALTKAIKGQNRIMQLKEKGKELRNILAQPEAETSESEPLVLESNQVEPQLIVQRKGTATFHRVSGWIQKNMPQNLNVRKKLSAWTKAMGISRWLSAKVIKQNRSPKKSKSSIVKHRMALRVASKTSLVSKNKKAKEKAGVGGDDVVPGGEKDTEAKYAVVLPRMNELGKTKMVDISQVAASPSAPSNMTETPGESISSASKPPKPGARLVLPVKPDLSLLKSLKKPLPGDLSIGESLSQRTPDSTQALEDSLNTGESKRKENRDGASVLQAARRKLDSSQINLTKMSLSGVTIGPTQARGPEPDRDAAVGIPRSVTQPIPNGEAGMGVSGARPICDEETDREVAQLMCEGGKYGSSQPEVHWAGNPQMSGDPQVGSTFVVKVHFYQYATFFTQYL